MLARLLGARFESLLADLQRIGDVGEIARAMRLLDYAVLDPADALFGDTVIRVIDAPQGGLVKQR